MAISFRPIVGLIVLSLFSQVTLVKGQSKPVSSVTIGDRVPNYIYKNVLNFDEKPLNLSKLQGKYVLLDFWSTSCASCIESWPKLIELQKKFPSKLRIILVNPYQSGAVISSLIKKREDKLSYKMSLPVVYNDTSVLTQFPHKTVPHVIWIDSNARLRYISGGGEVNEKNISDFISGKDPEIRLKSDVSYDVNIGAPLFINNNGGPGNSILWQSVVSGYFDGFTGTADIGENYGIISNSTIVTMFKYLLGDGPNRFGALTDIPLSRIKLDVEDTSKYIFKNGSGEIVYSNLYSYQLFSKGPVEKQRMKKMMLDDIMRYFNINYHWEEEEKMCLVFSTIDSSKYKYRTGEIFNIMTDVRLKINAISIKEFIEYMQAATKYFDSPYPIVDETGYTGFIGGIEAEGNVFDFNALNIMLNHFGLKLGLEKRVVKMLILSDMQKY